MCLVGLLIFGLLVCGLLNLLVIVVLLKKGNEISYMDLLMISLAISDLLQASVGYSVEVHSYYMATSISSTSCKISAFSTTFLGLVSISHLVGIALERHIIIRYPIKMRDWLRCNALSLYVIVPSWLYGFVWALFPLFGWNRYMRVPHMKHSCGLDMTSTDLKYTSYTYNLLVWCFVIPIIIISYCTFHICKSLRSQRTFSIHLNLGDSVVESRKKMERQQTVTSLFIIAAFLISWSPYALCVLMLTAKNRLPDHLLTVATLCAKSSTFYNPIIYSVFVEDFRARCKCLFTCRKEPPIAIASVLSINDILPHSPDDTGDENGVRDRDSSFLGTGGQKGNRSLSIVTVINNISNESKISDV